MLPIATPLLTLLLCASIQSVSAQTFEIEQRKLLAEQHIQECKTYKRTVENGQVTSDSALIYITKYNTNGCAVLGIGLDTAHAFATQWIREYKDDTVLYKHTIYNHAQQVSSVDEYTYDALGRLIQQQFQFFYYAAPRTTTLTMVLQYA